MSPWCAARGMRVVNSDLTHMKRKTVLEGSTRGVFDGNAATAKP